MGFPKLGVSYWGPYYQGILLFGGDYFRGPSFSQTLRYVIASLRVFVAASGTHALNPGLKPFLGFRVSGLGFGV